MKFNPLNEKRGGMKKSALPEAQLQIYVKDGILSLM